MGRKQCQKDGEKGYYVRKKYCTEGQEIKEGKCRTKEKTQKRRRGRCSERKEALQLDNPFTWTVENIDEVAAAVKVNPLAEYASVFWNIYKGPFSDIPCNEPLRLIIINAKKSYSAYYPIPDEEYLGDVMAMMGEKMLDDWIPENESLENYIRCRCRPNAEYGRSIMSAHGNKEYCLVKNDGHGSFLVCETGRCTMDDYPGYTKKYVNQPPLSMEAIVQTGSHHSCSVWEKDFCQIEEKSVRAWLMKTCRITEYEMQICEIIASYGKRVTARIVQEINETVVIPAGKPLMTHDEISALNVRVHKRAKYHYVKAMEGIQ